MKRILFSIVCVSIITSAVFAEPNAPDANAQLIAAAKAGDLATVQTLLAGGANVNAKRSTDGVSALMLAALNGHKEVVKFLLEKNVDANAVADSGMTALGAAKAQGHKDIVLLLGKTAVPAAPPAPAKKDAQSVKPAKDVNLPAVKTENKEANSVHPTAQTLNSPVDINCGILYCAYDEKTEDLDIFIIDPGTHKKINLTRGRLKAEGWGQPWGPIGSPDGQTVVMYQIQKLSNGKRNCKIWLLDIKDLTLKQVPGESGVAAYFTWSPDSSSFAFSREKKIIVCDKNSLNLKTVATGGDKPLWSPDGKWLAFIQKGSDTQTLQLVSQPNGEKKLLTSGLDTDNICWSPDSQKLAVVINGQLSLVLLNGEIQNLNCSASDVCGWSHDGKYIAFETRLPTKKRCLWILSLGDKKTSKVELSGDNSNGVWGPQSDLLAFWNMIGSDATLMAVGHDGKNPQKVDSPHSPGFMPPSWLFVGQAKQQVNGSPPATGQK